jgi:hypothetical protein
MPAAKELVTQIRAAGFAGARARRLVPGQSFYAFFATRPAW